MDFPEQGEAIPLEEHIVEIVEEEVQPDSIFLIFFQDSLEEETGEIPQDSDSIFLIFFPRERKRMNDHKNKNPKKKQKQISM